MLELSENIMRYAIFSDIHANLEALEAVLAKIDELAQAEPIDQIWFLGDLVGYGPDPNECIVKLRARTDVIIAGNHDWAAVSKIDLEDFSAAARVSAEWTAEQLTEEHRTFLAHLPERLEIGECTLVHGSPYGPLWEYLTSDILAERSFQYFGTRYCFVGHTHVPVIFQQPDAIANTPTLPLASNETALSQSNGVESYSTDGSEDETEEMVVVYPPVQQSALTATKAGSAMSAYKDPESGNTITEDEANALLEEQQTHNDAVTLLEAEAEAEAVSETAADTGSEEAPEASPDNTSTPEDTTSLEEATSTSEVAEEEPAITATATLVEQDVSSSDAPAQVAAIPASEETTPVKEGEITTPVDETETTQEVDTPREAEQVNDDYTKSDDEEEHPDVTSPGASHTGTEELLNSEIEELLTLLGLSQSMIKVTNEKITPPEGHWEAPDSYRAIINPGGVGQPRDGDPRAAFMIYDTEHGFEFYRVPYPFEKTQEKIIEAGLPQYLAIRLAYGQ
jgi:diadenosine tetraphosphatase ApaH/serine/threonine PP2A family protein phosphatase